MKLTEHNSDRNYRGVGSSFFLGFRFFHYNTKTLIRFVFSFLIIPSYGYQFFESSWYFGVLRISVSWQSTIFLGFKFMLMLISIRIWCLVVIEISVLQKLYWLILNLGLMGIDYSISWFFLICRIDVSISSRSAFESQKHQKYQSQICFFLQIFFFFDNRKVLKLSVGPYNSFAKIFW